MSAAEARKPAARLPARGTCPRRRVFGRLDEAGDHDHPRAVPLGELVVLPLDGLDRIGPGGGANRGEPGENSQHDREATCGSHDRLHSECARVPKAGTDREIWTGYLSERPDRGRDASNRLEFSPEAIFRSRFRAAVGRQPGDGPLGRSQLAVEQVGLANVRPSAVALDLDEFAITRHDDIEIDLGPNIFRIVEVDQAPNLR